MTSIAFFKYHGLGNDFILIDAHHSPQATGLDWSDTARRWCNRRTGIGADGLLVVSRPAASTPAADVHMRIFNADGSAAQMCGNGIRCVAAYVARRRPTTSNRLRVLTASGVMHVSWPEGSDASSAITVHMGVPRLDTSVIPVLTTLDQVVHAPLAALNMADAAAAQIASTLAPCCDGGVAKVTCVSMGNPHAVIFVKDPATIPLETLGPAIETLAAFPNRVNVHVASAPSRTSAVMRTWERGSGLTLACGTGACAVLVAGILTGRLDHSARIALPGGMLDLSWQQSDAPDRPAGVYMSGPAVEVFHGQITFD